MYGDIIHKYINSGEVTKRHTYAVSFVKDCFLLIIMFIVHIWVNILTLISSQVSINLSSRLNVCVSHKFKSNTKLLAILVKHVISLYIYNPEDQFLDLPSIVYFFSACNFFGTVYRHNNCMF